MATRRASVALLTAAVVLVAMAGASATASAEATGQIWTGRFSLVSYASQKAGTSIAARQPEADFTGQYVFSTDCSSGVCIATVVSGPRPTNPTIPQPLRYTWDGARWVQSYDWQWDCFLGDGKPKEWAQARSFSYYVPQRDGSLQGSWRTEIYGGACAGNVTMAVAAVPVW
ncbi:hypothetical protein E4P42_22465 [Mycobacterium sp. PS03-16]|uniref:hypothetical protein n=1 Tax=Mycobacterium sp. PS03-16 TaxID=2559611 RepID=UPI0010739BBF|nr:hypothetical protein [Mycobacterium sp. PS03-16]TFV55496.1 hypothetical protein E4P42_22465 [Mycobacterium sp. PS03-16]